MIWIWKRPSGVRVTQLCIFVDSHIDEIVEAGKNPELEDKIYNYIWLIIRSLAQKKNYFKNYDDYDQYAFFAASRMYFALLKSRRNAGKIIRGREIKPIKSVLNYTKALLYPMKVEYQNQNFRSVTKGDADDPAFYYGEVMANDAKASQHVADNFRMYLDSSLSLRSIDQIIADILKNCHFDEKSKEYKVLKYSIILTAIKALREKNKLVLTKSSDVIVWSQNKDLANLVEIYVKTFYDRLKEEISDCYAHSDISEDTVQMILKNQFAEAYGREETANED